MSSALRFISRAARRSTNVSASNEAKIFSGRKSIVRARAVNAIANLTQKANAQAISARLFSTNVPATPSVPALDMDQPSILESIAELMASEKFDKALALCEKALADAAKEKIDPEEEINIISLKADALVNLSRLDDAILTYEQGINAHPKATALKLHLADIFLEQGKYERVLELTARVPQSAANPEPDAFYLKAAAIFLMPGETATGTPVKQACEAAINLCDSALKLNPEASEALELKGMAQYKLGRNQEAIDTLESALKLDADLHDALYFRALALEQAGEFERALLSINRVLRLDARRIDARAWLVKASLLRKLERMDEAAASYEAFEASVQRALEATKEDTNMRIYRSLRLSPERALQLMAEAQANLLVLYEESGRYEDVLNSLQEQCQQFMSASPRTIGQANQPKKATASDELEETPDESEYQSYVPEIVDPKVLENLDAPGLEPMLTLVRSLVEMDKLEEAINLARWTVAIYPDSAKAWFTKARAAEALEELSEADHAFDKAISLDPKNMDYYISRAALLMGMGQLRPAQVLCVGALAMDRDNLMLKFVKAVTHMNLGEEKEALALFDEILEKDEAFNDYAALEMKARALMEFDRFADAEREYDRLLEKRGQSAEILTRKGGCVARQGKPDRAIELFDQAIQVDPSFMDSYVSKAALLYTEKQDWAGALAVCEKALEQNPEHEDSRVEKAKNLAELERWDECYDFIKETMTLYPNNEVLVGLRETVLDKLPPEVRQRDSPKSFVVTEDDLGESK